MLLVLALALAITAFFPGLAWAELKSLQALTQSAADAAALAGAERAVVVEQVDARGIVYARTVRLDPQTAAAAALAMWRVDAASFHQVQVRSWVTVANGTEFTVTARLSVTLPLLGLVSSSLGHPSWTVLAVARCGCA